MNVTWMILGGLLGFIAVQVTLLSIRLDRIERLLRADSGEAG